VEQPSGPSSSAMPTGFVPIGGLRKSDTPGAVGVAGKTEAGSRNADFVPISGLRKEAREAAAAESASGMAEADNRMEEDTALLAATSAPEPDGAMPRTEDDPVQDTSQAQDEDHGKRLSIQPLDAVSDLLGKEIPEGKYGLITDGACNSVEGDVRKVGLREVHDVDISLPVKRAKMVLRKSVLAQSATMMEREVLKEVVEEDHRRWGGCITLPASVMFFVFYLLSVIVHEDTTYAYISNQPFRTVLKPALEEVQSPEDVWSFLENTYLPFFFSQFDENGNQLSPDRWSIVGQYSQLIGSVQVELQRSMRKVCEIDLASHIPCYPQMELTGESFGLGVDSLPPVRTSMPGSPWSLDSNWTWFDPASSNRSILRCEDEGFTSAGCGSSSRRLKLLREELAPKMPAIQKGDAPAYRLHLSREEPYGQLYNKIQYLKERQWIDPQSSTLTLKAILLNNQLSGVPRIISVTCLFYFSRGGGVYTSLKVEGRTLIFFVSSLSYLYDMLFVVNLIIRSISTVISFCQAARRRQLRSLLNATFIFAMLTVSLSWINIFMFVYAEGLTRIVRQDLEAYLVDPSLMSSDNLYESTTNLISMMVSITRPLMAYANLFFLCQCFIALQWQPRLAVVTQTLLACSSDLFHYLIVLTMTITAFAISGMVIFGRRIADFAVIQGAIAVCFKIAIESEYDWETLSDTQEWWTAFTWVVLYLLLVVMLMVNMVLAIIMDVYAEVRVHSGDNMTIFAHLLYIYRKLYFHKQWVPDDQLLDQVSEMPQHITLLEVRQAFPEMHHHQLAYLQTQCQNKASRISRVGLNKTYTSQIVAAILFGLEEVNCNLERLKGRGWMAKGIEVGCNESREWVKDVFSSIAVQNHWMNLTGKHISTLQLRMQGVTVQEEDERRRQMRLKAGRSVKTRASQAD